MSLLLLHVAGFLKVIAPVIHKRRSGTRFRWDCCCCCVAYGSALVSVCIQIGSLDIAVFKLKLLGSSSGGGFCRCCCSRWH